VGRRDYEMEAATAAVDGRVHEPVVRALIVGAPGSAEGTLGGAIKQLLGRKRGTWPVQDVHVATEAAKKWTAWSATESGSQTNYFYNISLTVPDRNEHVVVQCPRTDSARATIQALEDATGSKPSRITARRHKKQRDLEARAEAESAEPAE
jgi:hypothetical protein